MKKTSIAILMGSKSDLPIMQACIDILDEFKIKHTVKVLSAHRTPAATEKFVKTAPRKGVQVIICAAGMAAHLAGVVASHTTLPVIGVPMQSKSLAGIDALFSTVQMPGGVPVGCMAIGKAGAKNAALFSAQILALNNKGLQKKLASYKKKMADAILKNK